MDTLGGLAIRLECAACGSTKAIRLADAITLRRAPSLKGRGVALCDCPLPILGPGRSARRENYLLICDCADVVEMLQRAIAALVNGNAGLTGRLTLIDAPPAEAPRPEAPAKRKGRRGGKWARL